jgi:hypothetical protein
MELEKMLQQLHTVSKATGLKMNARKTMVMTTRNRTAVPIVVEGKTLNYVPEYVYLGQVIPFNRIPGREIKRRISLA